MAFKQCELTSATYTHTFNSNHLCSIILSFYVFIRINNRFFILQTSLLKCLSFYFYQMKMKKKNNLTHTHLQKKREKKSVYNRWHYALSQFISFINFIWILVCDKSFAKLPTTNTILRWDGFSPILLHLY